MIDPKPNFLGNPMRDMLVPSERDMESYLVIVGAWMVVMFTMWGLSFIPSGYVVYKEYIAVISSFTCLLISISVLVGEPRALAPGLSANLMMMFGFLLVAFLRPEVTTGWQYQFFGLLFMLVVLFYPLIKLAIVFLAWVPTRVRPKF
ncbi:hypothetical protein ACKF11_13635 [Methylobacillus sp. Pita2]|uniref:hypothetical protein n=1 Tax=Methylobacillus sp. Pita2 TaxID=3383245 RepID=UPI0038B4ABEA